MRSIILVNCNRTTIFSFQNLANLREIGNWKGLELSVLLMKKKFIFFSKLCGFFQNMVIFLAFGNKLTSNTLKRWTKINLLLSINGWCWNLTEVSEQTLSARLSKHYGQIKIIGLPLLNQWQNWIWEWALR